MRQKVTLGMAAYDDFHGVYFTVQAALMYHGHFIDEIIIIDNNPESKHGLTTKDFAGWSPKVNYFPLVGINGTAQTRNEIFNKASGDIVIVCDPHVMFPVGSIAAAIEWITAHPLDLTQGPMLYDNLTSLATHFNLDIWRAEMWGIWDVDPQYEKGYPFEIPAQGLGAFATTKAGWLGFNKEFRGFGGEEGYIHGKYRAAGHKAWCVPQFTWLHRFGRPDGVPYPLRRYDKVINYVIGHKELGWDLTPIYDHFVKGGALSELEWGYISKGEYPQTVADCGCMGAQFKSLGDWFTFVKNQPSDINEHCDVLRELSNGRRVVDYGHRVDVSSVAIAAGHPTEYTMFYGHEPREWPLLAKYMRDIKPKLQIAKTPFDDVPECDLLLWDTVHTFADTLKFLTDNAGRVRDYIVIHDTVIYGDVDETGKFPGVMEGIRQFIRANRRWSVAEHYRNNNGLIVLVGNNDLKQKLPSKLRQVSNFTKALAKHVANGGEKVTTERLELRLIQCDMCPSRVNDKCGECGCPIELKASWAKESCPLAKWDAEGVTQ